jgi:hypothetical protein
VLRKLLGKKKKKMFRFHQAPAVKKAERREKRERGVGENFGVTKQCACRWKMGGGEGKPSDVENVDKEKS